MEDLDVYYYTNDRESCEVGFVAYIGEQIIPVKVKAEIKSKSHKPKNLLREVFARDLHLRFNGRLQKEDWFVNLSLYEIEQIANITTFSEKQLSSNI